MVVELIGCRTDYEYGYGGYTGDTTYVEEVVATFDNEKDAIQYIKDSRLKNPRKSYRPFRATSLLSSFEDASVEVPDESSPHNPTI